MKTPLLYLFIPAVLAYAFIIPTAKAQTHKTIKKTIVVSNGDTTINGRRLADMDKKERERFNKEFNEKEKQQIEEEIDALIKTRRNADVIVRKLSGPASLENADILKFREDSGKLSPDSITWSFRQRIDSDVLTMVPPAEPNRRLGPHKFDRLMLLDGRGVFKDKRNTQALHFRNVDKDGFSTELNFFVEDLNPEEHKAVLGLEAANASLTVDDFALFPNFSSGKTNVSFNLTTKGTAVVKMFDAEYKLVFTDKVNGFNGTYLKPVNMAKNGIYYISVNQNGKWFVRRIVKN
ncbi:T9SS type A sorting domain-containing protein [Desertivirga arenae]|uniref:T9SS type A sorting domain-containing protein n=1 Tax=Desertivirga arenae TaxID=2810309 RepID=UPI001A95E23B|nr:T9SS type A sorting domain-containing protein [Pedobacter sp. SYSU D00823]